MRILPPFTDNPELDAWNQEVAAYLNGLPAQPVYNQDTGIIKNPVDNSIIGYTYRYLHIKYADDRTGTNFSNSPTNRYFYGVKNSETSLESIVPSEYTWFEVPDGGFGTTKSVYYRNLGGRAADLRIQALPPSYKWSVDTGIAIDLDDLLSLGMIGTDELADRSVTTIKIALGAVTSDELADDSVTIDKLDTTGAPTANSFLNGDMEWVTPRTGWFLQQTILDGIYEIPAGEYGGHLYVDAAATEAIAKLLEVAEIGSTVVVVNLSPIVSYVVCPTGTIFLLNDGTEEVTLDIAANGKATLVKVETNRWVAEGYNLTTSEFDPSEDYLLAENNDRLVTEGDIYLVVE